MPTAYLSKIKHLVSGGARTGSYGKCMCNVLRYYQTIFQGIALFYILESSGQEFR